jgi:hypothetical protein
LTTPEDTAPHLFIIRIWTDPSVASPGFSRGLIEDARTRDRRYFRSLEEMQGFMTQALAGERRQADEPKS